jgi:hypothetical protein
MSRRTRRHTYTAMLALAASAVLVSSAAGTSQTRPRPQRFTFRGATIHGVDTPIRVVATGPINGTGIAYDKDNPGGRTGTLTMRFQRGSVFITNESHSLVAHPNYQLCTVKIVERGTYKIIGGTRHFRRATGHGTYVDHRKLIGGRSASGQCAGRNAPLSAVYDVVTMTGPAALR